MPLFSMLSQTNEVQGHNVPCNWLRHIEAPDRVRDAVRLQPIGWGLTARHAQLPLFASSHSREAPTWSLARLMDLVCLRGTRVPKLS